ncbi:MAG: LCP family protein [Elusimicrobia bacterium]|nr:LCP family protein [Elusimicrobiota bacterium]
MIGLWALLGYEWGSPVLSALARGEPCEILILGLDESAGTHRADMIALVRLDFSVPAVKILQIPRDTILPMGTAARKINSLMARSTPRERESLLAQILPWKSSIERHAAFHYGAFLDLIESVGPVTPTQERLTPEEALAAWRFRDAGGDLERLKSQQSLTICWADSIVKRPWSLLKLLLKTPHLKTAVETDMPALELAALLLRLRTVLNPAHFYFFEFPSLLNNQGRLYVNTEGLNRLTALWLESGTGGQPPKSRPTTLEVLNGSNRPGLALAFTRALRRQFQEFDVLYFGNAPRPTPFSRLILRQGGLGLAKRTLVSLNKRMGLGLLQIISPNATREVDMTLLLGQNAAQAALLQKKSPWLDF